MPIDRRITNGLAWTGALLVVAIPAADIAIRQFASDAPAQVAVADPQVTPKLPDAVEPSLPTPAAEKPEPVQAEPEPAATPKAVSEPPAPPSSATTDPGDVSAKGGQDASTDPVDTFISSGRQLPSYISDGGNAATEDPARTASAPAVTPTRPAIAAPPADATAEPQPEEVASAPRTRIVTFPTPVSERPASVPRQPLVTAQPQPRSPLIVDQAPPSPVDQEPVVTAEDLADWESGPLSEFLARRQGQSMEVPSDYDPDGFFLDEGPNSSARFQRLPRAYGDEYFPFY